MKPNKEESLKLAIQVAEHNLAFATQALQDFICLPKNNIFSSMAEAESTIEDRLESEAYNDCEGSHNRGLPAYSQEFIVDGIHYIGTLTVEYNRHDKTYYFVDGTEFKITKLAV
jgi:hypothetical protein